MKIKKSEENYGRRKNTFLSKKNKMLYITSLNLLNLNRNVVLYNKIKDNCSSKKFPKNFITKKFHRTIIEKLRKLRKIFRKNRKPMSSLNFPENL